jgi:ATP-dependent protease HslVU (ClpYQ) peptidase subunit
MGADSAGVSGLDLTVRADAKVFVNGDFLMGCAGSFRQTQLLRYTFVPPECWSDEPMRYMVCQFIDAVRTCFDEGGINGHNNQVESVEGIFLVGYRGHIYRIDTDYQVGESLDDFMAIGSGHTYARGAMYASAHQSPLVRVDRGLHAAAHLNGGVCPPFIILSST